MINFFLKNRNPYIAKIIKFISVKNSSPVLAQVVSTKCRILLKSDSVCAVSHMTIFALVHLLSNLTISFPLRSNMQSTVGWVERVG